MTLATALRGVLCSPLPFTLGGATRGCENCSFSLFFFLCCDLDKTISEVLAGSFFATELEEIGVFKGLAKGSPGFLKGPFSRRGAADGNSVCGQGGREVLAPRTLSLKWQVHVS